MQEYFEHAAPDGTLATLGELGAEEEFYAAVQRPKKKHNRVVQEEDATVARAGELQRSQVPPPHMPCHLLPIPE